MFKSFFGCTASPFDRSISTKLLFQSEAHQELIGRLFHVAEIRYFALCSCDVGAGKSTAARAVSDHLNLSRHLVLFITDSVLTPRNFYYEVLHQLGIPTRFYRGDAKRQLVKALMDMHESNRIPVIIIEEGLL